MSEEIITKNDGIIPIDQQQQIELIQENMAGVEASLPEIKIVNKTNFFELPDGEQTKEIEGVILFTTRTNSFWAKAYEEAEDKHQAPDCFSLNGVITDSGTICASCEKNQWGSAPKGGKGKACNNRRRLFVILKGFFVPYMISLPPTSIQNCEKYITLLTSKGQALQSVFTKIRLEKIQAQNGIEVSRALFQAGERLTPEQFQSILNQRNQFMPVFKKVAITTTESTPEERGEAF